MIDPLDVFVFAGALFVLVGAGRTAISSSMGIARILHISEFVVGFVLIAVATSIPELFVSSLSSLYGRPGIALGNVIGANIADIALILGITGLLGVVTFRPKSAKENAEILFLISFIPLVLMGRGSLGAFSGLALLAVFVLYVYFLTQRSYKYDSRAAKSTLPQVLVTYAKFFSSMVAVIISSDLVVRSGATIATAFGVSDAFIGLTLVSLGTTLPELTVNMSALRQRRMSLAVGNILGSCVTNLTLVLGTAALISPLSINAAVFGTAMTFLLGITLFLWYQMHKGGITKTGAVAMILAYILFILVEAGIVSLPL